MNARVAKNLLIVSVAAVSLSVAFVNCGKSEKNEESASTLTNTKLSDEPCENELMNFYTRSYHPFLMTNCSSCHSKGPGKGQFANSDPVTAYKDFMQVGYSKVSANAISDGHNPPYSGSQHTLTINELKLTWLKALSEYDVCLGGDGTVQQNLTVKERAHFALTGKQIPTMNDNESRDLEFVFAQDLSAIKELPLPDLRGARFGITVTKVLRGTDRYYSVHSPRIYGSAIDIRIKGIFTKINGRYINYSTNFRFVDTKISSTAVKTNSTSLVSTGAVVVAGVIFPDDALSFDFELLEPTTIPPPVPPAVLSFSGVRVKKVDQNAGEITFTASIDKDVTEVATFTVSVDGSALCNSGVVNSTTCLPDVYSVICPNNTCPQSNANQFAPARSVVGTSFNRFDWDYKLTTTSFSFDPGGSRDKVITIKTSKDERYETNQLLTLKIEAGLGNITVSSTNNVARAIYDKRSNRVPPNGEITYTMLMRDGTLFKTCTECHNSAKRDGGYDIQDYELMTSSSKQILVPGGDRVVYDGDGNRVWSVDYAPSLMYRRTIEQLTPESLRMPRQKVLTPSERLDLEGWLTSGAKNN